MARRDALLRLHKSLQDRRASLLRKLSSDLGHLGSNAAGDQADVAFDTGNDEMFSQLAELESRELSQIDRALARLRQGTYGQCESCGSKIPVERLNVLPYSTLCIKCQREMEQHPGGWDARAAASWERAYDSASSFEEPREVNLSDIEMDLSNHR